MALQDAGYGSSTLNINRYIENLVVRDFDQAGIVPVGVNYHIKNVLTEDNSGADIYTDGVTNLFIDGWVCTSGGSSFTHENSNHNIFLKNFSINSLSCGSFPNNYDYFLISNGYVLNGIGDASPGGVMNIDNVVVSGNYSAAFTSSTRLSNIRISNSYLAGTTSSLSACANVNLSNCYLSGAYVLYYAEDCILSNCVLSGTYTERDTSGMSFNHCKFLPTYAAYAGVTGTVFANSVDYIGPGEIKTLFGTIATLTENAYNSIDNPFGNHVLLLSLDIRVSTGATATSPNIDCGIGSSATTDYTTLFDDLPGETAGVYNSLRSASGMQIEPQLWQYATGNRRLNMSIKGAAATGMVATYIATVVGL